MDFSIQYTDEQETFRLEVNKWLEENASPILCHRSDPYHEPLDVYMEQRKLGRLLGEVGWLFPTAPKEYGGGGLQFDDALIIMEELGKKGIGLPPYYDSGGVLGSVAILVWGTDDQKQRFLPPIYRGQVRTWQLLTEPSAGSDLAGVTMTAVRDGDDYVLNGQKIYIGSDHGAEALWTIARTSTEAPRHKNLSWFMIDGDSPGITIQPMRLIGGVDKNTIFFDGVRVPASSLVGGENNGWAVASTHLELEHGFRPDFVLGHRGRQQMARLLEHCRQTTVRGQRIIDDPNKRDLICQAYIRHEIQRLWGLRNFWLSRQNLQSYEGAQSYHLEKVTGMWMNRVIAEVTGPAGLTWSPSAGAGGGSIGKRQAEAISESHGGGTIDIQRVVMARRLGIGRPSAEAGAVLA